MENNTTELGYSPDALAERQAELLALLRQIAPEVLSDNQIDVEKLKELIGQDRIAPAEHYELSWAGKAAARREIQKTTSHTLLPDVSNPEQAAHMLIEGENLEVLRVLQKSYHGKVKMIYIDPPYNTGNDSFVYPDDYSETLDEYLKRTGEKNEAGYLNKQSLWKKNSKESGQYHSAWLSMMYPRLYLARNLLREDGVVFISIDDNEVANLKLLCDEIFGEENQINPLIHNKLNSKNDAVNVQRNHEYILCYAKYIRTAAGSNTKKVPTLERNMNVKEEVLRDGDRYYLLKDPITTRGDGGILNERKKLGYSVYFHPETKDFFALQDYDIDLAVKSNNENEVYSTDIAMVDKGYIPIRPPRVRGKLGAWTWEIEKFNSNKDQIVIHQTKNGYSVRKRVFIDSSLVFKQEGKFFVEHKKNSNSRSILEYSTNDGSTQLSELMGHDGLFNNPKNIDLLKYLVGLIPTQDFIAIDFFSGSGSTLQAVMELNLEDGGSRQCICVQMPELLDEESEAYKFGYLTIADITRARIDKVIAKLKAEHPDKTADLACAQFTLAPSNFKVWRGDVADEAALRETLHLFQRAEKNGPSSKGADTQKAMLTELLLKHGLGALGVHAISKPVQLAGVTVYRVLMHDNKQLWLCFEPYTSALKNEIIKARPAQVVLLNSCFVGIKADELLSNLQLELAGLDIGLTVI